MNAYGKICFANPEGGTGEGRVARSVPRLTGGKIVFSCGGTALLRIETGDPRTYAYYCLAYWTGDEYTIAGYGDNVGRFAESDDVQLLFDESAPFAYNSNVIFRLKKWRDHPGSTLRIHFVYVSQYTPEGGETEIVAYGTNGESASLRGFSIRKPSETTHHADITDPYVDITFDSDGNVTSITQGGLK